MSPMILVGTKSLYFGGYRDFLSFKPYYKVFCQLFPNVPHSSLPGISTNKAETVSKNSLAHIHLSSAVYSIVFPIQLLCQRMETASCCLKGRIIGNMVPVSFPASNNSSI